MQSNASRKPHSTNLCPASAHAKFPSTYCFTTIWRTFKILALSAIHLSRCTHLLSTHSNQYLNLAKMTYDVLQGLFSPQTQYFLCCPPAEVMHLLLFENEFHISAVEVNVFQHEHAAVPSILLHRKVFDTFLLP